MLFNENNHHQKPEMKAALPRVNPGSTRVELANVRLCSVNTKLPGQAQPHIWKLVEVTQVQPR